MVPHLRLILCVKSGKMHSSQYGGGTANVEYEFLTQNSTAFLPVGAMPYQQYIKKNTSSIVAHMNSLNYKPNVTLTYRNVAGEKNKVFAVCKDIETFDREKVLEKALLKAFLNEIIDISVVKNSKIK